MKTEVTKVTKTSIVSTLLCAALLLSFAPAGARAQTLEQPKAAAGEARSLTAPHAAEKPTLKALFAESAANLKSAPLTGNDFKGFEKGRWQNDPQAPKGQGWSTRTKVIVIVVAAVVVGLAAWAASKSDGELPPLVDCSVDPFHPDCL